MRILIYAHNYFPEKTGCGKYTGEMAPWLAKQGHDVHVICSHPFYPEWQVHEDYQGKAGITEQHEGVTVHRTPLFVPDADNLSTKNRILHELSYTLSASRHWLPKLFGKRFDVCIAVCPFMQAGAYPFFYRLTRGVPWVFHIQDLQVDAAVRLGMIKGGLFSKLLYRTEEFLLRSATRVSTISETMRRRIVEKGVPDERTFMFPNWSDIQFIRPMDRMNEFRDQLGLTADDLLVLYAGAMGQKQGLEIVLETAKAVESHENLHFVMVGSGPARSALEQQAREMKLPRLRFLDLQPLEMLPKMLAAADIHLVVQKREAADLVMPSKLTNILAAGRCSVATAEPGTALHQVLTEHKAGIVCEPENQPAFQQALVLAVEDKALREQAGLNARTYAERYLDRETILRDFEKQLISLAQ